MRDQAQVLVSKAAPYRLHRSYGAGFDIQSCAVFDIAELVDHGACYLSQTCAANSLLLSSEPIFSIEMFFLNAALSGRISLASTLTILAAQSVC